MTIFSDATAALAELRADYLPQVASYLSFTPTDARLGAELKAAELEAQRRIGVFLEPTEIFPMGAEPTPDQIAELGEKPWRVEGGYDMEGSLLGAFQWASIQLRQAPLIEIKSVKFVYPTISTPIYEVPNEWIYPDLKAALIQFTPKPTSVGVAPTIIAANVLAQGSAVPQMVRVHYIAGLEENSPYLDEIRPLIMRMALLRMTKMLPASASISSDGLSQSKSFNVKDWSDAIDSDLRALKDRIKGPVWGVM